MMAEGRERRIGRTVKYKDWQLLIQQAPDGSLRVTVEHEPVMADMRIVDIRVDPTTFAVTSE
jgi:hypothetical protein